MPDEYAPDYELIMPFVVVNSKGGPYDDQSFVAGWQCAVIDEVLRTIAVHGGVFTKAVLSGTVPQLDLIAMKHGYELDTDYDGTELAPMPEGWAHATFSPLVLDEDGSSDAFDA